MVTWFTADTPEAQERLIRPGAWPDAPIENAELCEMILDVAREQVITFGPALALVPDGQPVPDPPARYVYAQLQQAINLWNAGRATPTTDVGSEGYSFTPRPLDKTIRGIIRPIDGKPDAY